MAEQSEARKNAARVFSEMWEKRQKWEPKWKLYKAAFAPSRGRFTDDDDTPDGAKLHSIRRNSNPFRIADEYAAGVQSGLVSPTRQWFSLTLFDKNLRTSEAARRWIGVVEEVMAGRMLQTNFYDQVVDFMKEQGVFGTAAMFIEEDPEDVFRCKTMTAGQYAIDVDDKNRVNRFARKLKFTLPELVKEFGEENLPEKLKRLYAEYKRTGKKPNEYTVHHLIQPNDEYRFGKTGSFKYQSLWWLDSADDKEFLRKHGYEEFPVVVGRWRVVNDDVYGSEHPAEVALDDAMTLQELELDGRSALEHAIKPAMLIPRTLLGKVNARPLGLTPYDPLAAGTAPVVQPLHNVIFDHQAAEAKIALLLRNIEQAFYIDLFRMWSTDLRIGRTATEIQAREDEKAYMLGPITLRQTAEVLTVAILRIYKIMARAGVFFPPAPPELRATPLKVEYMSEFALLQKRSAQGGIETLLQFVAQLMQLQGSTGEYPEVLDYIDADQIVETVGEMYALPEGIIVGDDKVAEKRDERMQKAAQMQQAAELQQTADNIGPMADAAQTMSETPIQGQDGQQSSVLDSLLNSVNDGSMGDLMNQMAMQSEQDMGRGFA